MRSLPRGFSLLDQMCVFRYNNNMRIFTKIKEKIVFKKKNMEMEEEGMRIKHSVLKKIVPLFLALTLMFSMLGIGTLVARAESTTEIEVIEDDESLEFVEIKVTVKDSSSKKVIESNTAFNIYAKSDEEFEQSLGVIYIEDGEGTLEVSLEPGKYILQQSEELEGYDNIEDDTFEIKASEGDEETTKEITVYAKASKDSTTAASKKDTTKSKSTDTEDEDDVYHDIAVSADWDAQEIPTTLGVNLICDGDIVDTVYLNDNDEGSPWSDKFLGDFPKKDSHLTEYEYTVEPKDLNGYLTSVSGNPEDGFVLTIKELEATSESASTMAAEEVTTVSVPVKAVFKDFAGNKIDGTAVTAVLTQGTVEKTLSLSSDNEWSDNFEIETDAGDEYSIAGSELAGYTVDVEKNDDGTYVITYTKKYFFTVQVSGDKPADSIQVDILKDKEKISTLTFESSNDWSDSYVAEDGNAVYTVSPQAFDGYEYSVSPQEITDGTAVDINYTKSAPESKTTATTKTVKVNAVFKDYAGNDITGTKVTAVLKQGTKETQASLSSSNNWTSSFKEISADTSYTVSGSTLSGYTVSTKKNSENDYTITYTKKYSFTVKVSGTKPDTSVKVTINKDGKTATTILLRAKNKWTYTYTPTDSSAKYTITPQSFDDYTYTVSPEKVTDGATMVITYTAEATTTEDTSSDEETTTASSSSTTATSTTTATTQGSTANSAETGDDNHLLEYIIILCVAVGVLIVVRKGTRSR